MKADGDVPAKKLDGIERVIPRRERFRLPGLVVCIRDFTKFFQEEEIFGVPVLRASEKHGYFCDHPQPLSQQLRTDRGSERGWHDGTNSSARISLCLDMERLLCHKRNRDIRTSGFPRLFEGVHSHFNWNWAGWWRTDQEPAR